MTAVTSTELKQETHEAHEDESVANQTFGRYLDLGSKIASSDTSREPDQDRFLYLRWFLNPATPLNMRYGSLFMFLDRSFQATASIPLLYDAIIMGEGAVSRAVRDNASESNPVELVSYMILLARVYTRRFSYSYSRDDLDRAIFLHQRVASLRPMDDPEIIRDEGTIAELYLNVFLLTKNYQAITEALSFARSALRRSPTDPFIPTILSILAKAYKFRYEEFGLNEDWQSSVEHARSALNAAEEARWEPASLAHLRNVVAATLIVHEKRSVKDVNEAIDLLKRAIVSTADSSFRLDYQNTLIGAYIATFNSGKNLHDIDEAIRIAEDVLKHGTVMTPRWRASFSMRLVQCYDFRYMVSRALSDEDKAIQVGRKAMDELDQDDTTKIRGDLSTMLTFCYWERFNVTHDPVDQEEAIRYALEGSRHDSSPDIRTMTCFFVANFLHYRGRYEDAIQQYRRALQLMPQFTLSRSGRGYRNQSSTAWQMVAPLAAACCVSGGHPDIAVELLESGRSMGWAHNLHLRTGHDQLMLDHPDLAKEMENVNLQLEAAESAHNAAKYGFISKDFLISSGEESLKLSQQRENLLTTIRNIQGYERFLLSSKYEELRAVSSHGPVVVIVVSTYLCCALILAQSTRDRPQVVPLSEDLNSMILEWSDILREATEGLENGALADDEFNRMHLRPILRQLWKEIVAPIREVLRTIAPYARRIWWCPTQRLTFLPMHLITNGLPWMRKRPQGLLRLVASYTTTITSLLHMRQHSSGAETMSMLAISCATVDGYDDIPETSGEVQALQLMSRDHKIDVLMNADATVDRVLSSLSDHNWLHLACHGVQSHDDAYRSHFLLSDGPLYLSDMVAKRLSNPQFAFLSACHTATGIPSLSDEAMHLAAALHYLGFRGSIATMWAVDDGVAPRLAKEIYSYMLREPGRRSPNVEDAADALAKAVDVLKREGVSLSKLAPFIHIGV